MNLTRKRPTQCKTILAVVLVVFSVLNILIYVTRDDKEPNHFFGLPDYYRLSLNSSEKISKRIPYNIHDHYICPDCDGGMGNQMFQFASSYGIARHKNMKLLLHESCKILSIFDLNVVIVKDISICESFKTLKEYQNAIFTKSLMTFDSSLNVRLKTYLQSYRYFDEYKMDLRKQLTFRSEIQSEANEFIDKELQLLNISCKTKYEHLRHTNESIQHGNCMYTASNVKVTLIGLQVRRGDWLKQPHPRKGFKTASKEYLQRSIEWYQNRYQNLIFIVASNGMAWTKENIPKNITVIYIEFKAAWVEMAILALCDHFISSVGTFGWWAGWLAGGNVTYYKWPAREGTELRRSFNFSDHFYPTWVGL